MLRTNAIYRYMYTVQLIQPFSALSLLQCILYGGNDHPPPKKNCPFYWGIWVPPNTWSLGPTRVFTRNRMSVESAIFCSSPENLPILHNGAGLATPNCPFTCRGLGPSPNTWFLGHTRAHKPNGISIGSALLVGLQQRQTDRSRHIGSKRAASLDPVHLYSAYI